MPLLHCEIGEHDYFRKLQCGRLPRNCPEHTPEKPIIYRPIPKGEHIDHSSGIPTVFPAELQAALEAAEEEQRYETLTCEAGHEWRWERKRGKKPTRCPEHRSAPFSPQLSDKTTDSQARVIASILEAPRAASCRCGLQPTSTPAEIRAMGGGCTMPSFVCPVLDTVRRQLNL